MTTLTKCAHDWLKNHFDESGHNNYDTYMSGLRSDLVRNNLDEFYDTMDYAECDGVDQYSLECTIRNIVANHIA